MNRDIDPGHPDPDTIAAIATGAGDAGIAIVRVSGSSATGIARRIFTCQPPMPDFQARRLFRHGYVHAGGAAVDEVLLLVMRAPHSYTGEDVVEFQGHGGGVSARRILRLTLQAGARLAAPGEFTRRAFLNGRLDLMQAEAVLDLIRARSDRAAAAALEQLAGKLSAPLADIHRQLMAAAADLAAALDFPDDEMPDAVFDPARQTLHDVRATLTTLLDTWQEGHLLREGALTVIAGRPNAGKSTLLNALLGRARAIVSPIPGTTRDVIEETCILNEYPLRLVDTAGLRATACAVEQEGVRRARKLIRQADLHLYIVDAAMPLDQDELDHLANLPANRCVLILNKTDLPARASATDFPGHAAIPAVLTQGVGLPAIKAAMLDRLQAAGAATPPHASIAERHRALLDAARFELDEAVQILGTGRDDLLAPAAAAVRAAAEQIGMILGKTYHPELLDAIFSRFCIGK